MVYGPIFFENLLRMLDQRRMTKLELSQRSGVSVSFVSEITNGKANPSLRVMESIADALGTSLPVLLGSSEPDGTDPGLPKGFTRLTVILPDHQAFIVRKWDWAARRALRLK